jgi:DNA polymerase-4
MERYSDEHNFDDVINNRMTTIGVWVSDFVEDKYVQYTLFGNKIKEDRLRKTVYGIKNKFGAEKIIPASELSDAPVLKDVIGFGSIKDLHDDMSFFV